MCNGNGDEDKIVQDDDIITHSFDPEPPPEEEIIPIFEPEQNTDE
jgi:hypothetical protein